MYMKRANIVFIWFIKRCKAGLATWTADFCKPGMCIYADVIDNHSTFRVFSFLYTNMNCKKLWLVFFIAHECEQGDCFLSLTEAEYLTVIQASLHHVFTLAIFRRLPTNHSQIRIAIQITPSWHWTLPQRLWSCDKSNVLNFNWPLKA